MLKHSDSGKRLGGGLEQNAIYLGLVLIRDGTDLRRQGERHMIIGDWQQLGFARREPLSGGSPLAFGTMPVATRIVGNARVGTVLAALDMTRSWAQLTCPTLSLRQASPWWRKISAASSFGRDMSGDLCGRRLADVQSVKGTFYLSDRIDRNPGIPSGGVDMPVS